MLESIPTAGLVVRPGDTLIVALTSHITVQDGEEIKRRLLARIPGLADVLLITQAAALAAYRPEAEDA